jgi:hypothetical protein
MDVFFLGSFSEWFRLFNWKVPGWKRQHSATPRASEKILQWHAIVVVIRAPPARVPVCT